VNDRFMAADSLIFLYYGLSVFLFFLLRQLADFGVKQAGMIWSINNILCSFLYINHLYLFKIKEITLNITFFVALIAVLVIIMTFILLAYRSFIQRIIKERMHSMKRKSGIRKIWHWKI
jgi:succinate-acetate transporter protein